jgi:hypothetical protein
MEATLLSLLLEPKRVHERDWLGYVARVLEMTRSDAGTDLHNVPLRLSS